MSNFVFLFSLTTTYDEEEEKNDFNNIFNDSLHGVNFNYASIPPQLSISSLLLFIQHNFLNSKGLTWF